MVFTKNLFSIIIIIILIWNHTIATNEFEVREIEFSSR